MSKKLKKYEVLVKALSNFSLVNLNVNVLRKEENVLAKIKGLSSFVNVLPYLSFVEENGEQFTVFKECDGVTWDGKLYYSTNTVDWNEWDGSTVSSSEDGKLYFRGEGNSKVSGGIKTTIYGANIHRYDRALFGTQNKKRVQCLGNIETLLDYKKVSAGEHPVMAENCFEKTFCESNSLTKAPDLPATELTKKCYSKMFYNCPLTVAPELPATTLAELCYDHMFEKCTSLTVAPDLPATTLADSCYNYMFYNCSSLTQAPKISATTLAPKCCYNMFWNCASLTTAPELPATELASDCYMNMFNGCTALTKAPELPATKLAVDCYNNMFLDCTSLAAAPELHATELADYCYGNMFRGCRSLAQAPELPATVLTKGCYGNMFMNCTALVQVPEFPATTLADSCYGNMLSGCTSLSGTIHCPASTASDSNRLDLRAKIPANTAAVVYDL